MWVVTWTQGGMRYRAVLYRWEDAFAFALDTPGLPKARVVSAATWQAEQDR